MKIRMKVPYDNGRIRLEKGDIGDTIPEHDRARFVRAGLAEEVKATKPTKPRKAPKAKAPAAAKPAKPAEKAKPGEEAA